MRDYLLNLPRFKNGTPPDTKAVLRPVIIPAFGALQRLFAGATDPERALGLRFVNSKATGFTGLRIDDHIARVRLTGGCGSGGSTFTIADEIMPTLTDEVPRLVHLGARKMLEAPSPERRSR